MNAYVFRGPGKADSATIVVIAATIARAQVVMSDAALAMGLLSDKFECVSKSHAEEVPFVAYADDGDR